MERRKVTELVSYKNPVTGAWTVSAIVKGKEWGHGIRLVLHFMGFTQREAIQKFRKHAQEA